jgi:mono/diheme cytochrome c family protein
MIKNRKATIFVLAAALAVTTGAYAAKVVEQIEVEGLVSPASPKALTAALEEQLEVKVLGYDLYGTANGWPILKVEYDSGKVTRDQIEKVIDAAEDPSGTSFKVHRGEVKIHLALLDEEMKAESVFAAEAPVPGEIKNSIPASPESHARGEKLYLQYCSKCHGINGNGAGPSAHGFSTDPRQLWAWYKADESADPYLFWFITNGRSDMPPWGVILSEDQRWDLVNYIKTLAPPNN